MWRSWEINALVKAPYYKNSFLISMTLMSPPFIWIYKIKSLITFSPNLLSLLYYFSKSKNLPLYDDLNLFLESTKKFIPQTNEVIKRIQMDINGGKPLDAFHGLLILPEIYTNETGKFCILILDEFHDLEEFVSPTAFQDLGKKIMTQKRCFYIFSSSYPGL